MSDSSRTAVIVIGSGQSARLVATRLRAAAKADVAVTVLGPRAGQQEVSHCRQLAATDRAVIARLDDGRTISADAAILATGCASFASAGGVAFGSAKRLPREQGVAPEQAVLIAGTGSRALRYALAAAESGHRGTFLFVGRHAPVSASAHGGVLDLSPADIPLGTGLRFLLRWFRRTADWAAARGLGAGDLVNGLRPHLPLIWRHLTASERRRFVVHLRPFWLRACDSVTAEEQAAVRRLFRSGQARLLRGRCLSVVPSAHGAEAELKLFPAGGSQRVRAGLAVSFEDTPPGRGQFSGTLIASLIDQGLARPDDIDYGLDVTEDCALIDAAGRVSDRIFAVGAPTRGRFVDAMELDCIRLQSERVARSIFAGHLRSVN